MRGTGRSHDLFETESINYCDGWSILLQTPHNEPEGSWMNTSRDVIYMNLKRLTLFGLQSKTWNRVV